MRSGGLPQALSEEPADALPGDRDLAGALAALGSPLRLTLLRALVRPRALSEIVVRIRDDDGSARSLARQTVRAHLDRLMEEDVVLARETADDKRSPAEYVVNPQRLYALSHEIKDLARLRPAVEIDVPTVTSARGPSAAPPEGPRLVVVSGLHEGLAYPLSRAGHGPLLLGRSRSCDVPLDFDPFVSTQHAQLEVRRGGTYLTDLPDNRNGTRVNFQRIAAGEAVRLARGDVVSVGRSSLVYQE